MRDAAEVQPRCSRGAVEMQPRTAEISGLTSAELPQIPQQHAARPVGAGEQRGGRRDGGGEGGRLSAIKDDPEMS